MTLSNPEAGTILIVDDNPTNLDVLYTALVDCGWEILVARSGERAIERVEYAHPDLILLDIMMPGIDGFATYQQLQQRTVTQDIPIIFITALDDTASKVKGLAMGAVDYITKPFHHEEVIARVQTHLKTRVLTRRLQQEVKERQAAEVALEQFAQRLELIVQERTQELTTTLETLKQTQTQLVQTEKIASLGQLVAGLAHEINNPMSYVSGNLDCLGNCIQEIQEILIQYRQHYPNPPDPLQTLINQVDLDFILEDLPKMLKAMKLGTDRIREVMTSLRTFLRVDEAEMQEADLHEGLDSTLLILGHRLKANSHRPAIQVIREYGNLPLVQCYAGQLNQVFMNLLSNAIDALDEASQGHSYEELEQHPHIIHIHTQPWGSQVMIAIADNGIGMSPEVKQKVFDAFFTTKPAHQGTGLGLSISHQIITRAHGGTLQCFSEAGQKTEFQILLPIRHDSSTDYSG